MKGEISPKQIAKLALLSSTWVLLSASLVILNKYILSATNFRFVISLAFSHMLVATVLCRIVFAFRPKWKNEILPGNQSADLQLRVCVIAALFATSLTASNAALARLDVSSVQMIKALNPAIIYAIGVIRTIERPSWRLVGSLSVICGGILYSVQGVLAFQPIGFLLQIVSILADGARYVCLQVTLQSCSNGLDPINVLHMVAPIASVVLWAVGSFWEFPKMHLVPSELCETLPLVLASSILAFALNICSYVYIKATSALTMSVSGILKDVMMIEISVAYFGSNVSSNQCAGYLVAISGTLAYISFRNARAEKYAGVVR